MVYILPGALAVVGCAEAPSEPAQPSTAAAGTVTATQVARLVRALEIVRDSSASKAKNWTGSDESRAREYRTQARAYATALGGINLALRGELR